MNCFKFSLVLLVVSPFFLGAMDDVSSSDSDSSSFDYPRLSKEEKKQQKEEWKIKQAQQKADEVVLATALKDGDVATIQACEKTIPESVYKEFVQAAVDNDRQKIRLFLEANISPNHTTTQGCFPLYYATEPSIVQMLKAGKANMDLRGPEGMTSLIAAVYSHNNQKAEALLQCGANPDIPMENGTTALMKIAQPSSYNEKGMKLLLSYGADVSLKSNLRWTIYDYLANYWGDNEKSREIKQTLSNSMMFARLAGVARLTQRSQKNH